MGNSGMNGKLIRQFEEKVEGTVRDYQMILPGSGVVVGVSGGADSVCLLRVLTALKERLPMRLHAVHVEHGLRGKSSLADAAFTQQLCRELDIPCSIVHVDAAGEAARRGLSVEEAGRILRYEAFARAVKETDSACIATAHHAEDQVETMLLNLSRGTGLTGMGGIRPAAGKRIRPLLFVQRGEIEAYLQAIGQTWQTDETNGEEIYARNRLRLQVLPVLQENINARAAQHFGQAALDAQRADAYLEKLARSKINGTVVCRPGRVYIPVQLLQQEEELMQEYILRLCIRDLRQGLALKDVSRFHISELIRLAGMDRGRRLDLPAGLQAVREREHVVLLTGESSRQTAGEDREFSITLVRVSRDASDSGDDKKTSFSSLQAGLSVSCRLTDGSAVPWPVPQNRYTKWLAYDIMGADLCLRTRRRGDYLIVNAEGGRRKLKDYFIDQKIPRDLRDRVPVIAQGSHVLWVIGGRISEGAKASQESRAVLEITVNGYEMDAPWDMEAGCSTAGEDETWQKIFAH